MAAFDCKASQPDEVLSLIKEIYKYEDATRYIDWLDRCDNSKPPLLSESEAADFKQISLEAEAITYFKQQVLHLITVILKLN